MSRSKRFVEGLSVTYLSQFLVMLAGIWLTPFYLRSLGQHDYGLWLVGMQMLTYLTLVDFGILAILPRDIAYIVGRSGTAQSPELTELIGRTVRLVLWQTPFALVGAVLIFVLMPRDWARLHQALGAVLIGFVLMFPLRIFQAILIGLQDLRFVGISQIVSWIFNIGLTVLLILAGFGLTALGLGWVAAQTCSALMAYLRLRRQFTGVLPSGFPDLPRSLARAKLASGFWVSVAQVAGVLVNATDMLIIGRVLGPATVVPYSCTGKLVTVLANHPQAIMQMAGPGLCEMAVGEARSRLIQALTCLSQIIMIASGAVLTLILLVNQAFVGWWVGRDLYGGMVLTVWLLASMFARHVNTAYAHAVLFLGHERRLSLTNLADSITTLGGALILTAFLGPVGAPIGSLMGVLLVSLPRNLSRVTADLQISMKVLLRPWTTILIRAVPLWLAALGFSRLRISSHPTALVLTTVGILAAYGLVVLPLLLRDPLRSYIAGVLPAAVRARFAPAEVLPSPSVENLVGEPK